MDTLPAMANHSKNWLLMPLIIIIIGLTGGVSAIGFRVSTTSTHSITSLTLLLFLGQHIPLPTTLHQQLHRQNWLTLGKQDMNEIRVD
jgi:hypothetical protein